MNREIAGSMALCMSSEKGRMADLSGNFRGVCPAWGAPCAIGRHGMNLHKYATHTAKCSKFLRSRDTLIISKGKKNGSQKNDTHQA